MAAIPPHPNSQAPIVVLGDSDALLRVVSYVLSPSYPMISLLASSRLSVPQAIVSKIRMVILAVGAAQTEPLVMLGQAGLGMLVGVVPILLITERQFDAAPDSRVFHLDYPFPPDALKRMVQQLVG